MTISDPSPSAFEPRLEITQYAHFLRRFAAAMIDLVILIFLVAPWTTLYPKSKLSFLIFMLISHVTHLVYDIYFHAKFGQTIGKMIMQIELRTLDLRRVNFRMALLRSSVDILFTIAGIVGLCLATARADLSLIQNANWGFVRMIFNSQFLEINLAFLNQFLALDPINSMNQILSTIWVYSEFITMLFNKKSRALHDYIAGTVVIRTPTMERKEYDLNPFYVASAFLAGVFFLAIITSPKFPYFALPEGEFTTMRERFFSKDHLDQMLCQPDFKQCSKLTNDLPIEDDLRATKARAFAAYSLQHLDLAASNFTKAERDILIPLKESLPSPHEIFQSYLQRRFQVTLHPPYKMTNGVNYNKNSFDSIYALLDHEEHRNFFAQNSEWKSITGDEISEEQFRMARVSKTERDFLCVADTIRLSNHAKTNWDFLFKNIARICKRGGEEP